MFTFRDYTLDELLASNGKTFWTIFKNKTLRGIIRVIGESIYLLHNEEIIGLRGHNLDDEDRKEGEELYLYDWCIYDDGWVDVENNLEELFKVFGICKEKPIKKKRDFKLSTTTKGDCYATVKAVDAETGEHLRYVITITEKGLYRHDYACPDDEVYNIPKGMFDEKGMIVEVEE